MIITEAIQQRRSVRTHTGKVPDSATIQKAEDYTSDLKPPFGAKCRIALLCARATAGPMKPGTLGFIKDAPGYLALVVERQSAYNKQPWRVVDDGGAPHFYKTPSMGYESIDSGIALCHFEQSCIEPGIAGRYEVPKGAPPVRRAEYVI